MVRFFCDEFPHYLPRWTKARHVTRYSAWLKLGHVTHLCPMRPSNEDKCDMTPREISSRREIEPFLTKKPRHSSFYSTNLEIEYDVKILKKIKHFIIKNLYTKKMNKNY